MKPMDFVLMAAIILAAAGLFLFNTSRLAETTPESRVAIYKDGVLLEAHPLGEDRSITVGSHEDGGYNIVQISGGSVSVIEADCHDQVCVRTAGIDKVGQSIVCLPYRVIVTIEGEGDGQEEGDAIDAISQ